MTATGVESPARPLGSGQREQLGEADEHGETARHFGQVHQRDRVHGVEVVPHGASVAHLYLRVAGSQLHDDGSNAPGIGHHARQDAAKQPSAAGNSLEALPESTHTSARR